MKKHKFIVELEIPADVTITEMKEYISNAVKTSCGSLTVFEPLFDLNHESVKVIHVTRAKAFDLFQEFQK